MDYTVMIFTHGTLALELPRSYRNILSLTGFQRFMDSFMIPRPKITRLYWAMVGELLSLHLKRVHGGLYKTSSLLIVCFGVGAL